MESPVLSDMRDAGGEVCKIIMKDKGEEGLKKMLVECTGYRGECTKFGLLYVLVVFCFFCFFALYPVPALRNLLVPLFLLLSFFLFAFNLMVFHSHFSFSSLFSHFRSFNFPLSLLLFSISCFLLSPLSKPKKPNSNHKKTSLKRSYLFIVFSS